MSTLRILLIEDNAFFQGIWSAILGRATNNRFEMDWANNAYIAAEMLAQNKYDLVISDVILPGKKSGVDIWKEDGAANCEFIFVSSLPEQAFLEFIKPCDKNADHFIRKPLKLNYCVDYLARVLQSKQDVKAS